MSTFLVLAAASGLAFDFKLSRDTFDFRVDQTYPTGVSLYSIRDAFRNGDLQARLSEIATAIREIRTSRPSDYYLETTARVHGFSRTLRSRCRESLSQTSWTRSCQLDLSHSPTRSTFVDGSNSINCTTSQSGQVKCSLHFTGQPRPINLFLFSRNPEQLAISGSVETLEDTGVLFHYVSGAGEASARGQYSTSRFAQHVEALRNDWGRAERGELEGKTLIYRYSDFTGAIVHQVQ